MSIIHMWTNFLPSFFLSWLVMHMEFLDLRMDLVGKRKKKGAKVWPLRHKHGIRDKHMDAVGDILIVPGSHLGRRYFLFGQP